LFVYLEIDKPNIVVHGCVESQVLRAAERPHCVVVVRDVDSARALDIQAILHDFSVHYIDMSLVEAVMKTGLPRNLKKVGWEADHVGSQHLAIWCLYNSMRMEELDCSR